MMRQWTAFAVALAAALALHVPAAGAQRGECRDCDSARGVLLPSRDRVLAERLGQLSAEIERLRAELARTRSTDSSSARALRTAIESLVASQRHLEEAMREHDVLVRTRDRRQLETTTSVFVRRREVPTASAGYVGLTTEARYTVDESVEGRVRRTMAFPVIVTVAPGSPAHRAGLAAGDTVLAVGSLDGRLLEQRLGPLLRPGATLQFRVRRGAEERVLPVRVEPAPAAAIASSERTGVRAYFHVEPADAREGAATVAVGARPAPAIGATMVPLRQGQERAATMFLLREPMALAGAQLAPLSPDLAVKLGVEYGLLVLTVAPDTPGARAGLEAGDAIVGTEHGPLLSPAQLYEQMSASTSGALTLRVVRNREPRLVTVRW